MVVVGAIDGVVIQKAGDAAEADKAEAAVRDGARSAESEERPPPAVNGKIFDGRGIDIGGEIGAVGDHNRCFSGSLNRLDLSLDAKGGVDEGNATDLDSDTGGLKSCEAFGGNLEGIRAGLKMTDDVPAASIGRHGGGSRGAKIVSGDTRSRHHGPRLIGDDAANGAIGRGLR